MWQQAFLWVALLPDFVDHTNSDTRSTYPHPRVTMLGDVSGETLAIAPPRRHRRALDGGGGAFPQHQPSPLPLPQDLVLAAVVASTGGACVLPDDSGSLAAWCPHVWDFLRQPRPASDAIWGSTPAGCGVLRPCP